MKRQAECEVNKKRRVALKIPEYSDYEYIYDSRFRDDVVYWADEGPQILSREDYAKTRMLMQHYGQVFERIIDLDGEPIGTISARPHGLSTQCILSIVIAIPEYWGHGYGSVALKLFKTLLWNEGYKVAVLETYANNKRAQRCFMKVGFCKRRAFFSGHTGRFVVEMFCRLSSPKAIGEVIKRGDPRWKVR